MKKRLLLTIGILSLIVIVLATVLAHGRRVVNSLRTTQSLTYTRIAEGGTLSHHLEEIRQLAETWEPPDPNMLNPTEHDLQVDRLREFATTLNAGGTQMSDLRIIEIRSRPSQSTPIIMMFMHEKDYNNAELIAEMLDFTGICEDDIYIQVLTWGFKILAWEGHYEFMMPNQAVYDFLKPYLLLREFAMYVNSGTIYRDEIVVTDLNDRHQSIPIGDETPPHRSPRYRVSLSPNAFNTEVKNEILAYSGLQRNEVDFTEMAANSFHRDFLLVNEEWMQLSQYNERLHAFQDLVMVRSVRQNTVMDRVLAWASHSDFRRREPNDPYFNAGLWECMYYNEELREALLVFTGISEDRISFVLHDRHFDSNFHSISRHDLTPSQLVDFETLEVYMEKVNSPFWHDRYQHDPVITSIDLSSRPRSRIRRSFALHEYVVTLYDPDLIGRSHIDIAWRTRSLRAEIIATTGVSNFRFRAQDTPWLYSFARGLLEGYIFDWFLVLTGVILWLLVIHGFVWILMKRKAARVIDSTTIPTERKGKIHPMYRFRKKLLILPAAWMLVAVCVVFWLNPTGIWLRSDLFFWGIIGRFFVITALGIYLLANIIAITISTIDFPGNFLCGQKILGIKAVSQTFWNNFY